MRLPTFLLGLCGIAILSIAIGLWAGFSIGQLGLFVISVLVVVQLAYLAVIAALSAANRKSRRSDGRAATTRGVSRLLGESDHR